MKHYYGAQTLPIIAGRIVCLRCGKVKKMTSPPDTGRRAKCSRTRKYIYLGDGATGHISLATGKTYKRSHGHSGYYRLFNCSRRIIRD